MKRIECNRDTSGDQIDTGKVSGQTIGQQDKVAQVRQKNNETEGNQSIAMALTARPVTRRMVLYNQEDLR